MSHDVSSAPRPRSVGVVVLDTLTGLLAPFRGRQLPVAQRVAIGIGVGIVLIGAVVLVLGTQWTPPAPPGTPRQAAAGEPQPFGSPGGSRPPSATAGSPASTPPSSPSGTGSSAPATAPPTPGAAVPNPPQAQPLTARYGKVAGSETLAGYRATVTITNPGQVPATTWRLVITLPRETLSMSNLDGASADRRAAVWTLSPTSTTRSVPAGGSVTISFQVNGAAIIDATPTACTVDGRPCTGLP